jgi:hypothetical protein
MMPLPIPCKSRRRAIPAHSQISPAQVHLRVMQPLNAVKLNLLEFYLASQGSTKIASHVTQLNPLRQVLTLSVLIRHIRSVFESPRL